MDADALFEVLDTLGIEQLRRRHNNIMGCCPFHEEARPSWGISLDSPHKHGCFSCGARGVLLDLLLRIGHYSTEKARRLCAMSPDELGELPTLDFRLHARTNIVDKTQLYPFDWNFRCAVYFGHRGISPRLAKALGVVFNPKDCRALFPWYLGDRLVGVTGRALDDNRAKTIPYFGTRKGHYLYLPSGRISKGRFVITEGEIDALKVFSAGETNVGAIGFGNFTDQQLSLTLNCGVTELVTFFDDDETGRRLTEEAIKKVNNAIPVASVDYKHFQDFYSEKLDPGAMQLQHVQAALKLARKYSRFETF